MFLFQTFLLFQVISLGASHSPQQRTKILLGSSSQFLGLRITDTEVNETPQYPLTIFLDSFPFLRGKGGGLMFLFDTLGD